MLSYTCLDGRRIRLDPLTADELAYLWLVDDVSLPLFCPAAVGAPAAAPTHLEG